MARPYLDYYTNQRIIPVRQDLSDIDAHFIRREGLYRCLGLVPSLLSGRRIVEIGPGTGDNAVHTARLEPSEYLLIDGNPESIKALRAKIASGMLPPTVAVEACDILGFTKDAHFDLVLCEGVVPIQSDPAAFLRHVARLCRAGGVMVLTTVSATSVLAEVCRRMIKPIVAANHPSFDALLAYLTDFFKPDLDTLKGMTRRHEDWVLDCIMHPWGNGQLFGIPDAIDAIADDFDFHGASPNFMTDWRWYKAITEQDFGFNRIARETYWHVSAATIDYRCDPRAALRCDGRQLEALCGRAVACHTDAWESHEPAAIDRFIGLVAEIADFVRPALPDTARALNAFVDGAGQLRQGAVPEHLRDFRPLFGRGQQYASFIRRG